jgi:hypothetical protein
LIRIKDAGGGQGIFCGARPEELGAERAVLAPLRQYGNPA